MAVAIEYKGYTVSQSSYNHHIVIGKDGKRVMHIPATKEKSIEELKECVDMYIELTQNGTFDRLYDELKSEV